MTGIHFRFLFKSLSVLQTNRNPDFFPLDFIPLLVNIYSGISEADFLALLLLHCG